MARYEKILSCFTDIYGAELSARFFPDLKKMMRSFHVKKPVSRQTSLLSCDSILITYGDALQLDERSPLTVLNDFLVDHVGQAISTVHLLPFFPFSSDDGFSVIDFNQVDPIIGDWDDIAAISRHYDLMFDAVINHVSVKHQWFEMFLRCELPFSDYFISVEDNADLSLVFRPRARPLLTTFQTAEGSKKVWTTFSEDQVDLNFKNPEVLLEVVLILLKFVQHGARFIRLDAIAFIWKEIGTKCIHLMKAHRIVQLFRLIFDQVAPFVHIITETNVPHAENISYFGDGFNEAQLVYNFSLPPLVLHAFHNKSTSVLMPWVKSLQLPSKQTSFLNFLASHDGIGVTPVKGLIPEAEILKLCERVQMLGGYVSYKDNPDGSRSAYELNINYMDALADPSVIEEPTNLVADRFLASQSIMLALKGVPGIYYHSLLGSQSWLEGAEKTGRRRTINREKLNLDALITELSQEGSLRQQVFDGYLSMLNTRAYRADEAFSPIGTQVVIDLDERIFSLIRVSPDQSTWVLCVTNVSPETIITSVSYQRLSLDDNRRWQTILSRKAHFNSAKSEIRLQIGAYGVLWLISRDD